VGEIGVHSDDVPGRRRQRATEPGDVGPPLSQLPGSMQDIHSIRINVAEPIADLAGPIGRAVVDDQDAKVTLLENLGDEHPQIRGFVIGWHDHDCLHRARITPIPLAAKRKRIIVPPFGSADRRTGGATNADDPEP